jgi:predicted RNase H-like HicB family nuclease
MTLHALGNTRLRLVAASFRCTALTERRAEWHSDQKERLQGALRMNSTNAFTAVVKRDGQWSIGWIEEIPGVNSQGETREELLVNLRSALEEAIEMIREEALAPAT